MASTLQRAVLAVLVLLIFIQTASAQLTINETNKFLMSNGQNRFMVSGGLLCEVGADSATGESCSTTISHFSNMDFVWQYALFRKLNTTGYAADNLLNANQKYFMGYIGDSELTGTGGTGSKLAYWKSLPYYWGFTHQDEPDFHGETTASLATKYANKQAWDADRPMFMNIMGDPNKGIPYYSNYADVFMWDRWTKVTGAPWNGTTQWLEAMEAESDRTGLDGISDVETYNKPIFGAVSVIYPTCSVYLGMDLKDIRSNTYLFVPMGVKGIAYYPNKDWFISSCAYSSGIWNNATRYNYLNNQLVAELHSFDWLFLPSVGKSWIGNENYSAVSFSTNPTYLVPVYGGTRTGHRFNYMLKNKNATHDYLIVINKNNVQSTTSITVSSLVGTGTKTVKTIGLETTGSAIAGRTLAMVDGVFTDTFDGYAAHVYEISNSNPAPVISSYSNSKTNDNSTSITLNTSESVTFNFTANQTVTGVWTKDGAGVGNTTTSFSTSWGEVGSSYYVTGRGTNSNGTTETLTWYIQVTSSNASSSSPTKIGLGGVSWKTYSTGTGSYILDSAFEDGVYAENFDNGTYDLVDEYRNANLSIENGYLKAYGINTKLNKSIGTQTNTLTLITLNESNVNRTKSLDVRRNTSLSQWKGYYGSIRDNPCQSRIVTWNGTWIDKNTSTFCRYSNEDTYLAFATYSSNLKFYGSNVSYQAALNNPINTATDSNYSSGNLFGITADIGSNEYLLIDDVRVLLLNPDGTLIGRANRTMYFDMGLNNVTRNLTIVADAGATYKVNYRQKYTNDPWITLANNVTGNQVLSITSPQYQVTEVDLIKYFNATYHPVIYSVEASQIPVIGGGSNASGVYTIGLNGNSSWAANATLTNMYQRYNGKLSPYFGTPYFISMLRFDEITGTTVNDENQTSNNIGTMNNMNVGINNGGSGWLSTGCKYDNCIGFDGTNDDISIPSSAGLNATSAITVMGWVYPTTLSGTKTVISKYDGTSNRRAWRFDIANLTGYMGVLIGNSAGTSFQTTAASNLPLTNATWKHVAFTWDKNGDGKVHIYVNGTEVSYSAQPVKSDDLNQNDLAVFIGQVSGSQRFRGRLDDVRIYNRNLSQSEIQQSMNNTLNTTGHASTWFDAKSGNSTYQLGVTATGNWGYNGSNYSGNDNILVTQTQNLTSNISVFSGELENVKYYWETTSAQGGSYIPPIPVNLSGAVNWAAQEELWYAEAGWNAGAGNGTDYYNISADGTWTNLTTLNWWFTSNVTAHKNFTVSVYAGNSTYGLNSTPATVTFQKPNQLPSIGNITLNNSIHEGELFSLYPTCTDDDNDACTWSNTSAPANWTINPSTGVVSWQTMEGDQGDYYVTISVNDGYDTVLQELQISVGNSTPAISGLTNGSYNSETVNKALILWSWQGEHNDWYEIQMNGSAQNSTNFSEFYSPDIPDNTQHNISVRGYNSTLGVYTGWLNQTVNVSVPPLQVVNLTNQTATSTSVPLAWNASTETDFSTYEVFQDGVHIAYPATNSYTVTGLTAGTTYEFTVRANDTAGNWGVNSSALSVTTNTDTTSSTAVQVIASDTIRASNDSQSVGTIAYISNLTSSENINGTVRITYEAASGNNGETNIYKNGVAVGTAKSITSCVVAPCNWQSDTQNISIALNTTDILSIGKASGTTIYVRNFRLKYDYNYVPAVHGYVFYPNGTGISGATVIVAGSTGTTDGNGYYSINQTSLLCTSSSLCGYVLAAGISGYDANATYYNGTKLMYTNLTLTASGVQNSNMFFNDSQKMFDYFMPTFNTTGHMSNLTFDKDYFYYGEAEIADMGAIMYNSSNNRSVGMLFNTVNIMNHVSHDIILAGDPDSHGTNLTIASDSSDTHMEFFMAFFTDAVSNLQPHVDNPLWADWNNTLFNFNDSEYGHPEYMNSQNGTINNWAMLAMTAENYRCSIGRAQSCSNRNNISSKFSTQINENGYFSLAESVPVSAYAIFGGYWANETVKDGYNNQTFVNAVKRSINFTKAVQLKDGEWATLGRSSGHTWNLAQAIAFSFMQNGTDKGDWYRRADLAYSKIHQYEYNVSGQWTGAYYIVRNYYDPSLRRGYMNYSSWGAYNPLTGYFEARAGQLYDPLITETPVEYSNFADFNSSTGSTNDSGILLLNSGNYSIYTNPMYFSDESRPLGWYNGSRVYPLRFIITRTDASNVTIYPNPEDGTDVPISEQNNFDYFNSHNVNLNVSSFNKSNITHALGSNYMWVNWTSLQSDNGMYIGYWNLSATVDGEVVHITRSIGGINKTGLYNYRHGIESLWYDGADNATKIINGLNFSYTKGKESFNVTNTTCSSCDLNLANSNFDGWGQFGKHNRTLIFGNSTAFNNYISWWRADGSGVDANTTSANTMSLSGTTYDTGFYGQGFLFDGADDINTVTHNANLNFSNLFTFSAMLYPHTAGETAGRIYEKPNTYLAWVGTNNQIGVIYYTSTGTCQFETTGTGVRFNNWTNFVVTYNNGVPRVYLNGVNNSLSFSSSNCGTTINQTANNLYIGNRLATDRSYDGLIDDIYIMGRAVAQSETDSLTTSYDYQASTTNTYGYQMTQLPAVQSYTPETPVNDTPGSQRAFTVTFTKVVNVSWRINGTEVQTNESVTTATYTNSSAVLGTWEVNATGTNSYGAATQIWDWNVAVASQFIPPSPTNLANTTGNYWVNHTWQAGTGNITNSYNVSVNGTWTNGSANTFYNNTVGASNWSNITVYAYNSSGTGSLNTTPASMNTQAPAQAPDSSNYLPPIPTGLGASQIQQAFIINHSWSAGTGNITNSYNVSVNGTWANGTTSPFSNSTVPAHGWKNITVFAYNSSGTGSLNTSGTSLNTQINNNAITISGVSSSYTLTEGETLNIDANYADVDGDTGTFSDNASQWNVNTASGVVAWTTGLSDAGTYYWQICVSDGYGSQACSYLTVTVNDYSAPVYAPIITSWSNDLTSNTSLEITVNVNNAVTFTATANQTITTWTWAGATKNGGDGTTSSTASKTFSSTGDTSVSVNGTNANGDTQTVTWTVHVVETGGGGTDWDWMDGTVTNSTGAAISGATVSTIVGSAVTNATGYYTFGYVFVDGTNYTITTTAGGYTTNVSYVTFNQDHEIHNITMGDALTITTDAATGVTANGVILHGTASKVTTTTTVWFEWGGNANTYIYKSSNQSINNNVSISHTLNGAPLVSGKIYYFRAVATDGVNMAYGNQLSFTTLALGALPDYDLDKNFNNLTTSNLDPTNMSAVGAAPYTDLMGNVFWGLLFAMIFVMIFLRQEDITLPAILGLIIGGSLWTYMPEDWTAMAMSLTVVSFAGIVYSLIKGRS